MVRIRIISGPVKLHLLLLLLLLICLIIIIIIIIYYYIIQQGMPKVITQRVYIFLIEYKIPSLSHCESKRRPIIIPCSTLHYS